MKTFAKLVQEIAMPAYSDPTTYQNYKDGYRSGYYDWQLGHTSEIALAGSPGLPGYSEGYTDGQLAAQQGGEPPEPKPNFLNIP